MRHTLTRLRWFVGGCVAAAAVICHVQGVLLWHIAGFLLDPHDWEVRP
ncbi:MAG: hypothetical protein ACREQL_09355 [Candidatus Binatia bacterium]